MKILRKLLIVAIIITNYELCYGTFFDIESVRIGPNPMVKGKDPLIINYVASLAHSSIYYLYTPTGQLLFQKSYTYNTANITHAGECQFNLLELSDVNQLEKQVYILIMVLNSGTDIIKKREYVILK